MERINYSSGAKWEDIVGYSRAVKVGNIIEVTGTVAVDENSLLVGKNDAYAQTKFILEKLRPFYKSRSIIKRCGADKNVRHRHYTVGRIWKGAWRVFLCHQTLHLYDRSKRINCT